MPSKRTSTIIGIWVVVAVLLIVDSFLFSGLLLDSLFPGLTGIVNVLIFALIPFIAASLLLDRRASPTGSSLQPPRGARSVSGEPMRSERPKPRIKRDKRAVQLETIVVESGAVTQNNIQTTTSDSTTLNSQPTTASSSRFLRARRVNSEEDVQMSQEVEEQLDAIELEMAKLEEQLAQNGVSPSLNSSVVSDSQIDKTVPNTSFTPTTRDDSRVLSEETTSELQAIDELLTRLEQRMRAGGVDEETYRRLRDKYLKRRSELV